LSHFFDTLTKEIIMQNAIPTWGFWLYWMLAFLGFPIAGLLANTLGPVDTPVRALLAGAVSGLILGLVQWLVLRSHLSLSIWWVVSTSIGMSIGLAVSTLVLGSETGGNELLWRAAITGLCIGAAQWLILRNIFPQSAIWIVVLAIAWTAGWFVTRSAGVDLSFKWSVFGASGALTFQFITGLALYFLFRLSQGIK
jgi:hypothetical protein